MVYCWERKFLVRAGGVQGRRWGTPQHRGAWRGSVPVLGTEEGFLIRLCPDELVSPACEGKTEGMLQAELISDPSPPVPKRVLDRQSWRVLSQEKGGGRKY